MAVNITRRAWSKMRNILNKTNNNNGFLYSVVGRGCNGFNFDLSLLEDKTIFKIEPTIIENNDVKLYIEPLSEMYLLGTTIDYIHEDYSKNIYESKFLFSVDKKLASTCGCGISFTPKTFND